MSLWLLEKACQQLKTWGKNGFAGLKLAIKIADVHFYQDTLNFDIAQAIQQYQLSYDTLELELNENVLLQNSQQALEKLTGLRNLGVRISLEDFATSYTDLSYWQEFPLNSVKLNWYRLQTIFSDDRSYQITNATIALAHHRGMQAIATEIETLTDWQHLAPQEWDLAQGYYFSRPLAAKEFSRLLLENRAI